MNKLFVKYTCYGNTALSFDAENVTEIGHHSAIIDVEEITNDNVRNTILNMERYVHFPISGIEINEIQKL